MTYEQISTQAKALFIREFGDEWQDRYYTFIGILSQVIKEIEEPAYHGSIC